MRIMKMLWILGAKGGTESVQRNVTFFIAGLPYHVVDLYDGDLLCKRFALVTLDIYLDDHHLS